MISIFVRLNNATSVIGSAMPARKRGLTGAARLFTTCCLWLLISVNGWALEAIPMAAESFLDLKQDAQQAAREGRTLMLVFEQEGCVYCMEMRRVNFKDKEIVDAITKKFQLVQIDIWGDRELTDFSGATMKEKEYARRVNVQFTPMTIFFDADGKELFRMTGYYKPPEYKAALSYVSERHYTKEKFRDFARRTVTKSASGELKPERFFVNSNNIPRVLREAREKNKGLVLLFEQKQCMSCDELHDDTFGNPKAVKMLTDAYDVMRIDMWSKDMITGFDGKKSSAADFSEAADILYTPTMVFYDGGGKEIFRFDNYRKTEHLLALLTYLSTDARLRYKSFQDWLRVEHIGH